MADLTTSQLVDAVREQLGSNAQISSSSVYAYRREQLIPEHLCRKNEQTGRLSWDIETVTWIVFIKRVLDSSRHATREKAREILDRAIPSHFDDIRLLLDFQRRYPLYGDFMQQLKLRGVDVS